MLECIEDLEREHPRLKHKGYKRTGKCTDKYNCLAYAAGDLENWWEPTKLPPYKWPVEQYDYGPGSFIKAFESIGFVYVTECIIEDGFENIAVFVDSDGDVCHAAVQEEDGTWKSKCGERFDISHTLVGLGYGKLAFYMKHQRINRNLPAFYEDDQCEYHSRHE